MKMMYDKMDQFYEVLKEIGLTKREIACYTNVLELGCAKASEICKATSIPSSKIYEILDRLIKKGFITYIVKDNIKYYQVADPSILLEQLEEKKKKLTTIITELTKVAERKTPTIKLYEGYKSIFLAFTDLIKDAKQGENYLIFAIGDEEKDERLRLFFSNLAARRKEKGLEVKLLKSIKYYKKEMHTKLKVKYTELELPEGITIFRHSTMIFFPTTPPIAIKIENEQFTNKMRKFFLSLWKKAKNAREHD
jgi:sugar-specific transcriptional regulator TrmB